MNQIGAFRETLILANERGMPLNPGSDTGLDHLQDMWRKIDIGGFSAGKLGRWLGWAQCAVVTSGVATLEEMKEINRKYAAAEDDDHGQSRRML